MAVFALRCWRSSKMYSRAVLGLKVAKTRCSSIVVARAETRQDRGTLKMWGPRFAGRRPTDPDPVSVHQTQRLLSVSRMRWLSGWSSAVASGLVRCGGGRLGGLFGGRPPGRPVCVCRRGGGPASLPSGPAAPPRGLAVFLPGVAGSPALPAPTGVAGSLALLAPAGPAVS